VCAGALAAGARPGQVEGWAETAEASRRVREWRGAVLVKGSRRYQLETLLAEAAGTPVTARP
jgi:UDP-N-acetylmuramoyl-tripeptide--D-alanyl-D-alanine ligase